jgi:hypothetical protein
MCLHQWSMLFTKGVVTVTGEYLHHVVKFCYCVSVWCIFSVMFYTVNYIHRLVHMQVNRCELRVIWHVEGIKLELGVLVKHVSLEVLFQKSKPSILMRNRILSVTVM